MSHGASVYITVHNLMQNTNKAKNGAQDGKSSEPLGSFKFTYREKTRFFYLKKKVIKLIFKTNISEDEKDKQ